MSAYTAGSTGSGNTHTDKVISGGKRVATKKTPAKVAKALPGKKTSAAAKVMPVSAPPDIDTMVKPVRKAAKATVRATKAAITTPRMRGVARGNM